MEDVKHEIIGKGLARGATSLMETLHDAFGETVVLVAVLSVLIIPCTWKVLTARRKDGDGTDIVDNFINGFLVFASE